MLEKLGTEKTLHRRELFRRLSKLQMSSAKGEYIPVGFENVDQAN